MNGLVRKTNTLNNMDDLVLIMCSLALVEIQFRGEIESGASVLPKECCKVQYTAIVQEKGTICESVFRTVLV